MCIITKGDESHITLRVLSQRLRIVSWYTDN